MLQLVLFVVAFLPMILESRLSTRHERRLRASGAIEPAHDVFAVMRFAYPGSFLAMLVESWIAGRTAPTTLPAGIVVFTVAKALKYWAIAALGGRWTFRVLVPPHSTSVSDGPYRLMRHPNYVDVAGEIGGFALMAGAAATGVVAFLVFAGLLRARIRVEEQALGLR